MSLRSLVYRHVPYMRWLYLTLPPDLSSTSRLHVVWRQRPILRRMPFNCEVRTKIRQTRCWRCHLSATDQTTVSVYAAGYHGCPVVRRILAALPPDLLAAPGNYLIGCKRPIFGRMPFCCDVRIKLT